MPGGVRTGAGVGVLAPKGSPRPLGVPPKGSLVRVGADHVGPPAVEPRVPWKDEPKGSPPGMLLSAGAMLLGGAGAPVGLLLVVLPAAVGGFNASPEVLPGGANAAGLL